VTPEQPANRRNTQHSPVRGGRDLIKIEHRNALSLESAKTPCSLTFSGAEKPEYTAWFLNRVSEVRVLPGALSGTFSPGRLVAVSR
jgi:hypothetical protein